MDTGAARERPGAPRPVPPGGLGDTNWRLVFNARDQVALVIVQTWNDYHEQSQIEPSHNGRLGTGHYLLDKTRYYWERFKAGLGFEMYPDTWAPEADVPPSGERGQSSRCSPELPFDNGGTADREVDLATLWYSWYGYDLETGESIGGLGSSHWNSGPARAGITDEPRWGFYASDDPAVIGRQLDAMRQAGLTVILVSWFGWGDSDLDGAIDSPEGEAMHRATIALLDYIADHDPPFEVAIAVEPFMADPDSLNAPQKREILDYLWEEMYSRYADQMLQWHGAPLLISFQPLSLKEAGDTRYTHRLWGSTNDANWKTHTSLDWNGYPDVTTLENQISADGVLIVFPRFDEY